MHECCALSALLSGGVYVYIELWCGGMSVGNTLLLAGPGGTELRQPRLDWVMGPATPVKFACNCVCGAAGNRLFAFRGLYGCPHGQARLQGSQEYLCKREKEKTRRCWNKTETTAVMTIQTTWIKKIGEQGVAHLKRSGTSMGVFI